MGAITNIFNLVFGINLIVVGSVAFITGIISLTKKNQSVKRLTSVFFILAGGVAVYFGIILARSAYDM